MPKKNIPETLRLRLVVDVSYTLNETDPELLKSRLLDIASDASNEGRFTGALDAEVEDFSCRLEPVVKP